MGNFYLDNLNLRTLVVKSILASIQTWRLSEHFPGWGSRTSGKFIALVHSFESLRPWKRYIQYPLSNKHIESVSMTSPFPQDELSIRNQVVRNSLNLYIGLVSQSVERLERKFDRTRYRDFAILKYRRSPDANWSDHLEYLWQNCKNLKSNFKVSNAPCANTCIAYAHTHQFLCLIVRAEIVCGSLEPQWSAAELISPQRLEIHI